MCKAILTEDDGITAADGAARGCPLLRGARNVQPA